MWKAIVKAGNKPTTPTYISLNPDFTYIWGIDSSQSDPMRGASKGTWDITSENEIKLIPDKMHTIKSLIIILLTLAGSRIIPQSSFPEFRYPGPG